ncbi:adenine nucleotide transporter [Abortiporus biennis]|nr:adenine nucleotide transporter [Abortiporus biennis]
MSQKQLSPLGAAFAGALGGCFSNAVVYPLDVVKTRIQATSNVKGRRKEKLSIISIFLQILKEEGVSGLYRGFGATMLNTFSMQYAYFFFYSLVRTSYMKRLAARAPKGSKAVPLSTAAELLLGAVAGALAQIFTIPVAVIATRQQIGRSLDKTRRARRGSDTSSTASNVSETTKQYDDSFIGVAKEIVEQEGVTGLWLGIKPGLVLTVNPAITYGLYERVKSIMLIAQEKATGQGVAGNGKLNPWLTFAIGAMSKSLATIVTYPYIMAKIRIQARTADDEEAKEAHQPRPPKHGYHHDHFKHAGALDILARVWRKQGPLGWYQGMGAQITKAVISQALLFLSKEQFEHWTLALVAVLYRLQRGRA